MNLKLRETAVFAATEAGKILLNHYGKVSVEFKDDAFSASSVVTIADRESENLIVDIIKNKFPNHGIYAEETHQENLDAEYVWYIDPLDGTSNFTRNIPLFGISIGVIKNGQPVCGVLYFPVLNLLVEAEEGMGTLVNGERSRVSSRPLNQALYYSAGKHDGVVQIHDGITNACGMVKIIDSSSYEFAQIAMGDAEVYYFKNVPHDVVAGICIVNEAGGKVSDSQGNKWSLSSKDILVAPSSLHSELLSILSKK